MIEVALRKRVWVAIATLVSLSAFSGNACGGERLPEQIPSLSVTTEQAVRRIILAAEQIGDAHNRQLALKSVSYDLYGLKLAQVAPNGEQLEDALWKLSNPDSPRPAPSVLRRMSPDSVQEMVRLIKDVKLRDQCLQAYVHENPRRQPKELLLLIRQIEDSSSRGSALFALLRNEQVNTQHAKEYLEDVRRLGNPVETAGSKYALGTILSRVARDDPDAVAHFLREVLAPEDAVAAIGHAAIYCNSQQKSPTAAAVLLRLAAEMVPSCSDPAAATEALLHCWLAKHHPQLALELYDKFLEPSILETPDYPISYLWPAGVAATLERAERYCIKRGRPSEFVVSSVLGRIASFDKPELVIHWLESAEQSPLRDSATIQIAQGLVHHVHKRQVERATLARSVDVLTKFTLAIEDGQLRAKGCETLSFLVHTMRAEPPMALPQSVRDEYHKLWPEIRARLEAKKQWDFHHVRYDLAPGEVLNEAIRELYKKGETGFVAGLVNGQN